MTKKEIISIYADASLRKTLREAADRNGRSLSREVLIRIKRDMNVSNGGMHDKRS